jgi:hypothetical protein
LSRAKNAFAAPLFAIVLLLVLAAAAQANTIVVNDTDDPSGAGDCLNSGQCSLRQAVGAASSGDTIQLADSTYSLTQGTNIEISKSLTIAGNGVDATVIDGSGNGQVRIFRINGGTVLIHGLSITNGVDGLDEAFQSCSPCLTINANGGGALFNDGGTVTVDTVAFTDNGQNTPLGGAVSNRFGNLTLTDVSFTGNNAAGGGGLFVGAGNVTGVGVTFENNGSSAFDGGAAYVLSGNLSLTNATIVGNGWASSIGGGIANGGGTVTLVHDTFSGNIRGAIQTDQGAETIVGSTIIGAGFADGTDFACLPSGRWTDDFNNRPVGQAITNDDGNNFDQDGHCGFDGNGDIADADPRLASIADNGGPTRTQALLAGSQAIGNANELECPATDQRDITRDGPCDIGAFNTRPTSVPATPSTSEAGNITDSSADLHGTINLSGDAGGFHFLWGLSQDDLLNSTPVQGAGIVDSDTLETQTLSGLNPGTQYFYKIVADNSSGSTPDTASDIKSFTTQADPPSVFSVHADSVTDTTANLSFTINPNGDDTSYVIQYGDADPGDDQTTGPVDIGADAGDQQLTATLQNLDPNSTYHFEVIATNSIDTTTQSGQDFATAQQIGGIARLPIELDDTGQSNFGCPETARIDWGDNSGVQHVVPDCLFAGDEEDPAQYELTADHTYAQPGHYDIQITYPDIEQTSNQFAQIAENDVQPPSNDTLPAISGTTSQGQTLTTTDGEWTGDPSSFDYQWQNCDQNGENCTDTGEDQNTYALTGDDVGSTIRVIVSAANDGGTTPATSDATAVVAGPPPSNNGLPAISGTPIPGNPLTCSDGSWSNNPSGFAFAWNRDGSPISGATAQAYAVQAADQGHTLTCTVIAHNDGGSSSPATSAGVAVPSGSTGGSGSKPTPNKPSTSATKPTSTALDGSVNPGGLVTTAHFEYGLDSKYTDPGTSGPVYDLSTPSQNVGSGSSSQTVSASVSGLVPNALYHVRLVATNSAGTTFGPDATFTTPAAPAPGAPTVSKSFDVKPTQGVVLIQVNGKLVPLTQLTQIPAGAVIDALHGTLNLVTSTGKGHTTQTGTFAGAIFKVTQDHSGLTTLTLVENAFKGVPSYASCKVAHGKASAAALSSKTLQLLKGKDNHGKFRTKGRYAAATTRGTAWSVADRCDGTLTKVTQSSVLVNDFVRHVSLILHAGHSYLALAKPPKHK